LKEVLKQVVGGGQVILTAEGVELAAMIPMGDLDLLHEVEDAIDRELIEEARAESAAGGDQIITLEEIRNELHVWSYARKLTIE
jgi:hypothetical protein